MTDYSWQLLAKFLTGDDEDAVTKELLGFY